MSARPLFGVCLLATDRSPPPHVLAREVEARGFDMLFFPENSHVPVHRAKEWRHAEHLLDPLSRLYDPFVALSAAAVATERLLLGFAVCLLTHRDPINTAKAAASLDLLSNGRVILGIAGGALDEAMRNHGSAFRERWRIVRDRALAMRAIWNMDKAEYHGEYTNFDPMWCYPKPLQRGGPPLWIGSNSKWVPSRVADYADGWLVFNGRYEGNAAEDLRAACVRRERDFEAVTLALMNAPREAAAIDAQRADGFKRFIFMVPPSDEEPYRELDLLARLAEACA
ncbi:MAG: TIGR03619 family F420-dependent LLM class oxidoreductase [Gammaproteobacteria bacterium]|nr:TIGR03619 family F420-dependent LLM class oxidoreductase [Gammaproteobacteria bacterium]MBI5618070.1 TIGR03619 family F420-dependent LLM class oxidoreductase [Gammaproteobacteria bacterium]